MPEEKRDIDRSYPDFYERFIPAAIVILAIFVVLMILFSIGVGTGLLQY